MERRDPYIGAGTPPPVVERRSSMKNAPAIVAAVILLGCAAAAYLLWPRGTPPLPPPERTIIPVEPRLPLAQAPRHPIDKEPAEQPLPELKASDGPVAAALSALIGLDAFGQVFVPENLIRNIVATVDNLPREQVSQRVSPVRGVAGVPVTTGKGASLSLASANASRYAAQMRLVEAMATKDVVAFYRRHYPLFQQAYVDLGYPNGYFNDRVVEVIDHLLATPEPKGPLKLKQPKVLYEFADPALEELSAGQKTMLRIGSENRERVKSKLREVRSAIAAG